MAAIWLVLGIWRRFRSKAFNYIVIAFAGISAISYTFLHFFVFSQENASLLFTTQPSITRLFFMFFTGAAFFVLRGKITLSRWIFFPALFVLLASALISQNLFFVIYNLVLAYLLLFIAYVPSGRIRLFNRAGDYSYGIYLYAMPIQQSTVSLIPNISVGRMIIVSAAITFAFAFLSWHLVEKHALKIKRKAIRFPKRQVSVEVANE